jgi:hypothetical protein
MWKRSISADYLRRFDIIIPTSSILVIKTAVELHTELRGPMIGIVAPLVEIFASASRTKFFQPTKFAAGKGWPPARAATCSAIRGEPTLTV